MLTKEHLNIYFSPNTMCILMSTLSGNYFSISPRGPCMHSCQLLLTVAMLSSGS